MIQRFLLLLIIACGLVFSTVQAEKKVDKDKKSGDAVLWKSLANGPPLPSPFGPDGSSFPQNGWPSNQKNTGNGMLSLNNTSPAVSTGYYFVDSDDDAGDYWRPSPMAIDTSDNYNGTWLRIYSGPRTTAYTDETAAAAAWNNTNPGQTGQYGHRYFRNPALPLNYPGKNYFSHGTLYATDSTDDAIAGPMPIGISGGFYFNGVRYDSFYVSTNGLIALTNRRYHYDEYGRKNVSGDAYDPESMDWYVNNAVSPSRNRVAQGKTSSTFNGAFDPVVGDIGDATPDDFGYTWSVLGGPSSNGNNRFGGIRTRSAQLNSLSSSYRTAIIAPFWGDMFLSQWDSTNQRIDDFGQVWFRRFSGGDSLIVYFFQITPVQTLNTPSGSYYGKRNLRDNDDGFVCGNAAIILSRLDSSVVIQYDGFRGISPRVGNRTWPANNVFRFNTTSGVRGFARHIGYNRITGLSESQGDYEQYTTYFSKYMQTNGITFPHSGLTVKYKQWQNTLRVVNITYRVRDLDVNSQNGLNFVNTVPPDKVANYELLAGEERIGAIQPVAVIQNLTNDIQGPTGFPQLVRTGAQSNNNVKAAGINYVPQCLNFRGRFRIINEASERVIYNRLIPVDSICLATGGDTCTGDSYVTVRYVSLNPSTGATTLLNYPGGQGTNVVTDRLNGIRPYGLVQIAFPPFEPNEFLETNIGRLRAEVLADPSDPHTSQPLNDQWPFDDLQSVRLFSMQRLTEFSDDVREFHTIQKVDMPSVLKWVNIGGEVVQGDDVSWHPLPPRRQWNEDIQQYEGFTAANNKNSKKYSPVIKLNREPTGGDEIRSFPIDLRNQKGAVLALSAQRTLNGPQSSWDRGWCDQTLIGPEPRSIVNSTELRYWNNTSMSAASVPDYLAVDIAKPSSDQLHGICNIGKGLTFDNTGTWRFHPRRKGAAAITNMPAYALYGAGGYLRGWLESDKDSTLKVPDAYGAGIDIGGLRVNKFDDGIDYEYQKIFIPIPDTFISWPSEGAKNFRFRILNASTDDQKCITCIPDDDDSYFVDNVTILFPSEMTDIEMSSARIIWPYTITPASQAIKIPVRLKIANNTSISAPTFKVKAQIYRGTFQGHDQLPVYCKIEQLPFLGAGAAIEVAMPDWDARKSGKQDNGQFHMLANVYVPGGDLIELNDTTYYDFRLNFGEVFAYDPAQGSTNNVPTFSGVTGQGLNCRGFWEGGTGSLYGDAQDYYSTPFYTFGYEGGNESGAIASRFEIFQIDTVKGYQVFFGNKNQAPDYITIRILRDNNNPGTVVPGSEMAYTQRGWDSDSANYYFDQYVTYKLPTPLVLQRGKYWVSVSQLGETGMELGASSKRMGMRTIDIYFTPPDGSQLPMGTSGTSLMIEKDFRVTNDYNNLINDNFFAVEKIAGSGEWHQFMPNGTNPAYAHLSHVGTSPQDFATHTLSRGSWIPMIRPFLGSRDFSTQPEYELCDTIPVELSNFDGSIRNGNVELNWETASEINNYGFYIERRNSGSNDWNTIGFVKGAGNSTAVNDYNFVDKNVVYNTTYQYRLRQVDRDGEKGCESFSEIITVKYDVLSDIVLAPNSPNPFNASTTLNFYLPVQSQVKLEVLDVMGNVITTLANNDFAAGSQSFTWNGNNEAGSAVTNGTYIARLTVGDVVRTIKMSLVR